MGQQPNIELEISDLPRPTPHPAPARTWSPRRPGEIQTPDDMPWGGAFGTTGPDAGYALRLVKRADLQLGERERRHDVEVGLAAVAAARASRYGRAPTQKDVEVALVLLGFRAEGLPSDLRAELVEQRASWFSGLGHHPQRAQDLVAAIPVGVLESVPEELRTRMAAGERLIQK